MIFLSLWAGLLSGLCWLLGDILLVGFEVDKESYAYFTEQSRIGNKNLAMLMLSGSVNRLRLGALVANFSIPLMLVSLYALFGLTNKGLWAYLSIALLGIDLPYRQWHMWLFTTLGSSAKRLINEATDRSAQTKTASLSMKQCSF